MLLHRHAMAGDRLPCGPKFPGQPCSSRSSSLLSVIPARLQMAWLPIPLFILAPTQSTRPKKRPAIPTSRRRHHQLDEPNMTHGLLLFLPHAAGNSNTPGAGAWNDRPMLSLALESTRQAMRPRSYLHLPCRHAIDRRFSRLIPAYCERSCISRDQRSLWEIPRAAERTPSVVSVCSWASYGVQRARLSPASSWRRPKTSYLPWRLTNLPQHQREVCLCESGSAHCCLFYKHLGPPSFPSPEEQPLLLRGGMWYRRPSLCLFTQGMMQR